MLTDNSGLLTFSHQNELIELMESSGCDLPISVRLIVTIMNVLLHTNLID